MSKHTDWIGAWRESVGKKLLMLAMIVAPRTISQIMIVSVAEWAGGVAASLEKDDPIAEPTEDTPWAV